MKTVIPKSLREFIELRAEEQEAGEWPEALQQDLDDIAQTDPITGKSFITLFAQAVPGMPLTHASSRPGYF
jgi:hypothetical protein